ncbi:MAG TPA: ribose-phosphate pyrophosphokinase [Alphaproteobacteria bacterium]|nr:ribose-phosphate pyrophosphokinase [Alphaproteobacteria bacterium]
MTNRPALIALNASRGFGERVAAALDLPLSAHEERLFEDGEHKARPLESVRGRDVYVLQCLHATPEHGVDERLNRLLFMIAALKDAGAARVTAVVPYLCYARKDRRTKPRDPVTTRYVACLFEAVGTDRICVLDVHNPAAYQNAFRIPAEHLEARHLLAAAIAEPIGSTSVVVVSPDSGGVKRADAFRQTLAELIKAEIPLAFAEKHRSAGVVSGEALVGEVSGRVAVLVDDLVSTGTTLLRAARRCREMGAIAVHAVATHGLLVGGAPSLFASPDLDSITLTDSVPIEPRGRLRILSVAPLMAEAIRRLHVDGSLIDLNG